MLSVMQEHVYQTKVSGILDLRQHIMQVWDEFEKGIIDASIKQWRNRLRSCVAANGGQFEQKLLLDYH